MVSEGNAGQCRDPTIAGSGTPPSLREKLYDLREKAAKFALVKKKLLEAFEGSKRSWKERKIALAHLPRELVALIGFTPEELERMAVDPERKPSVLQRTTELTVALVHWPAGAAKAFARWKRKHHRQASARLKRKIGDKPPSP
ncbi:MAG: hypothetical protein PHI63_06245 [Patescibacteria group bacterium]|nr:hypothetical protein [Patescibacteria group bacterium]